MKGEGGEEKGELFKTYGAQFKIYDAQFKIYGSQFKVFGELNNDSWWKVVSLGRLFVFLSSEMLVQRLTILWSIPQTARHGPPCF